MKIPKIGYGSDGRVKGAFRELCVVQGFFYEVIGAFVDGYFLAACVIDVPDIASFLGYGKETLLALTFIKALIEKGLAAPRGI